MRIYLIGFMGSGKSRAGRKLAPTLQLPFVDLDDRIEAAAGCSISDFFARHGESAFRQLEARCLRQTEAVSGLIVACGGGTPCYHDNMAWMNRAGLTVFLDPPLEVLAERLQRGRAHRPLLKGMADSDTLRTFIREKLDRRRPFYEQAAIQLRPDDENVEAADLIVEHIPDIIGH